MSSNHQDKWLESQTADELRRWIRKKSCLCDLAGVCNGCRLADIEAEIREEIDKIKADERFHYKPANVLVNAPLALEQVAMKARVEVLQALQRKLQE